MAGGGEVAGIHDILLLQRACGGGVKVLAPGRRADENDGLRTVFPDGGDDVIRVFFHLRPAAAVRFIADFVENVTVAAVLFCHLGKEGFCRLPVGVRISIGQDVPVDDDVHAEAGCRLHAPVQHRLKLRLIPTGRVAAVFLGVHREPYAVRAPVVPQGLKCRLIHVLRIPGDAVRADALQLDDFLAAVREIDAFNMQRAVLRVGSACRGIGGSTQPGQKTNRKE